MDVSEGNEKDKLNDSSKEEDTFSRDSPQIPRINNSNIDSDSPTERPYKRFKKSEDSPTGDGSILVQGSPDNHNSQTAKAEEGSNVQVNISQSSSPSHSRKTNVDSSELPGETENQVPSSSKNTESGCRQTVLQNKTQSDVIENKAYPEARSVDIELIHAVYDGNLTLVEKLLLEGDVDVNGHNTEGLNALMISAMRGHVNIAKELIRFNADVNAATRGHDFGHVYRCDTSAALFLAAERNHADIVRVLVENGACVDCKEGIFGPLHIAVKFGKTAAVTELIAAGADVSRKGRIILIFYSIHNITQQIVNSTDIV